MDENMFHKSAEYFIYFNNKPIAKQFKYKTVMHLLNMGVIKFYETRYIGGAVHYFKVND